MGKKTIVSVPRAAPWQRMANAVLVTECLSEGGVDWSVIVIDEDEYPAWIQSLEDDKTIDRIEEKLGEDVPNKNGDVFPASPLSPEHLRDAFKLIDKQPLRAERMFIPEDVMEDIVKWQKGER